MRRAFSTGTASVFEHREAPELIVTRLYTITRVTSSPIDAAEEDRRDRRSSSWPRSEPSAFALPTRSVVILAARHGK